VAAGPTTGLGMSLTTNVNAGAGDVRLVSANAIDQTVTSTITANNLGARAVTGISLTSVGNDADTVAFANTGAGTIAYQDTDGFTVGALIAQTLGSGSATFIATSGVVSRGLAPSLHDALPIWVAAGPTTGLGMSLTTNVNAGA